MSEANKRQRYFQTPQVPATSYKGFVITRQGSRGACMVLTLSVNNPPVLSTLLTGKAIENAGGGGILFEVPANHPDQKPIIFGRYQREDFPRSKEGDEQG